MTAPQSSSPKPRLTERQRDALRQMDNLENKFGPAFLRNSLHEVRFTYEKLERIAKGLDA